MRNESNTKFENLKIKLETETETGETLPGIRIDEYIISLRDLNELQVVANAVRYESVFVLFMDLDRELLTFNTYRCPRCAAAPGIDVESEALRVVPKCPDIWIPSAPK